MKSSLSLLIAAPLLLTGCVLELPGDFPDQAGICEQNTSLEGQRAASAAQFPQPVIEQILVNGFQQWSLSGSGSPVLRPGDKVTLVGTGFGGDYRVYQIFNSTSVVKTQPPRNFSNF